MNRIAYYLNAVFLRHYFLVLLTSAAFFKLEFGLALVGLVSGIILDRLVSTRVSLPLSAWRNIGDAEEALIADEEVKRAKRVFLFAQGALAAWLFLVGAMLFQLDNSSWILQLVDNLYEVAQSLFSGANINYPQHENKLILLFAICLTSLVAFQVAMACFFGLAPKSARAFFVRDPTLKEWWIAVLLVVGTSALWMVWFFDGTHLARTHYWLLFVRITDLEFSYLRPIALSWLLLVSYCGILACSGYMHCFLKSKSEE